MGGKSVLVILVESVILLLFVETVFVVSPKEKVRERERRGIIIIFFFFSFFFLSLALPSKTATTAGKCYSKGNICAFQLSLADRPRDEMSPGDRRRRCRCRINVDKYVARIDS